jgi:hypothetical protein
VAGAAWPLPLESAALVAPDASPRRQYAVGERAMTEEE